MFQTIKLSYIEGGNRQELEIPFQDCFFSEGNLTLNVSIIQNEYGQQVQIDQLSKVDFKSIQLISAPMDLSQQRIFCNGFQSWTESDEFLPQANFKSIFPIAKSLVGPYGDYLLYDYPKPAGHLHAWTYAYIRYENHIHLLGTLDETGGYTRIDFDTQKGIIKVTEECSSGQTHLLQFYEGKGKEMAIFKDYFERFNCRKIAPKAITGWTSWYHYYTKIDEAIIQKNIHILQEKNIPINVFQIDDGWQKSVGDWEINQKFPKGLKTITDQIHQTNYEAGLWLAPFICEKKSKLYKEHPEWILKDEKGKFVRAGFSPLWSGIFYALDFYQEGVRNYLKKVFRDILDEWQFDFVKLDFLYAVALQEHPQKSRGQIMYEAMSWLRSVIGNKKILGCGVPLGPSFGLVDYCRIGADVHLKWEHRFLKWIRSRERVSTICSLKNTIHRHHLKGKVFGNDPDVFILRSKNNKLSTDQKYTLLLINQIFGDLVFTSDYIGDYDQPTMQLYLSQFPFKSKTIQQVKTQDDAYEIHFQIEQNQYLAYANLSAKTVERSLPTGDYFHNVKHTFVKGNQKITIPPYTSFCYLKIPKASQQAELIGSTGHLFPLSEVADFKGDQTSITLRLHSEFQQKCTLFIRISSQKTPMNINGEVCKVTNINGWAVICYKHQPDPER